MMEIGVLNSLVYIFKCSGGGGKLRRMTETGILDWLANIDVSR